MTIDISIFRHSSAKITTVLILPWKAFVCIEKYIENQEQKNFPITNQLQNKQKTKPCHFVSSITSIYEAGSIFPFSATFFRKYTIFCHHVETRWSAFLYLSDFE